MTRQPDSSCAQLLDRVAQTQSGGGGGGGLGALCDLNTSAAVAAAAVDPAAPGLPAAPGGSQPPIPKEDAAAAAAAFGGYSAGTFCPAACNLVSRSPACATPDNSAATQSRAEVLALLNAVGPVLRWDTDLLLGRAKYGPGGALLEATAVRLLVSLDCTDKPIEMCEAIEFKMMEKLGAAGWLPAPFGRLPDLPAAQRNGLQVQFFSLAGQNREMLRAMLGAMPLLGFSIIMISCYLAVALGKFNEQVRHSKIFIGVAGCSLVGMASVFTFGICCGFGVMVTPISQVAPFLLLGIGVDDMFVIVRTLEQIPTSLTTRERIRLAYRRCGGAIAVTSFTDALAFATGATIKFPAMRAFCINAGVGVVVTFVLQCTFMAAVITISDRSLKGDPSWGDRKFRAVRKKLRPAEAQFYDRPLSDLEMPTNTTRELFQKTLAPFVEHGSAASHWAVMGVFGVMGLIGLYGSQQMVKGFPITDVFQYDSYISKFLISQSKQFPDQAYPFFLVFPGGDYADASSRAEMSRIQHQLEALPEVSHNLTNWVEAYEKSLYFGENGWADGLGPVKTFVASAEGVQYGLDIVWNDAGSPDPEGYCAGQPAGGCIIASRFLGYLPGDMSDNSPLKTAEAQEEIVKKIKAITAGSTMTPAPFAFCFIMLVWEVWTELIVQMMTNLAQAFVAILLGCAIFLLHPGVALIVTLTVAVVELELAAACAFFGINLNTVTVVIFIMNFGLVVDYSAHISHHFMTSTGTRRHRAAVALTDMGSGVFNGAFTTMLGMLPLWWAPFETGVVFCNLFAMIISLGKNKAPQFPPCMSALSCLTEPADCSQGIVFPSGVLHAFVLLPLLLANFGPDGIDPTGVHNSHGPGPASGGGDGGGDGGGGGGPVASGSSSSPLQIEMHSTAK